MEKKPVLAGGLTLTGIVVSALSFIAAQWFGATPEAAQTFAAEVAPLLLNLVGICSAIVAAYGRLRIKRVSYE